MIIHKVCCQVLPYKRWKEMLPGSNRFEWSWVKSTAWYCNLDMAWQKAKLKTHFEKSPQKSVSCFLQATKSYITMPTCSLFSFLFLLTFHLLASENRQSHLFRSPHPHLSPVTAPQVVVGSPVPSWYHQHGVQKIRRDKTEKCKGQVLQTDVWSFQNQNIGFPCLRHSCCNDLFWRGWNDVNIILAMKIHKVCAAQHDAKTCEYLFHCLGQS